MLEESIKYKKKEEIFLCRMYRKDLYKIIYTFRGAGCLKRIKKEKFLCKLHKKNNKKWG